METSVQKSSGGEAPPDVDQHKQRNAVPKLYPQSALFARWGDDLSEDEQRDAQALYEIYGYNVFLSNQLPLDRNLPDLRDSR